MERWGRWEPGYKGYYQGVLDIIPRVGEIYWKRSWESHGQIWGLLCGERDTLEAERSLVLGGVVTARAVALELDRDGLDKDLGSIYSFHIHQEVQEVLLQS